MKKIYLSLLCATVLAYGSNIAIAGDKATIPPSPQQHEQKVEHHHKKFENKLADDLKLTDEQRTKAKELRKASREKIKPLMDEMKALRKKMDKIRDDNMKAFEDILTPEQKATFAKIKTERKAFHKKMKAHHGHRHLPPMPME